MLGGPKGSILGAKDPLPSSVLVEGKPLSSTSRVESWAHRLDPLEVQVSVSSHQLRSPERKIQGLGAVPTPVLGLMVAGARGAVWRVLPAGIYGLPSPVLVSLLPSLPQLWCDFSPGARAQTSVYLDRTRFH